MPEIRQVRELYTNHQFFLLFFSAAHAASSNNTFQPERGGQALLNSIFVATAPAERGVGPHGLGKQ
jgi:hypothetical protein